MTKRTKNVIIWIAVLIVLALAVCDAIPWTVADPGR